MAIPISFNPKTSESERDIEASLEAARITHGKAILAAYALLQDLHDARILALARGVVGAGETIVTKMALAAGSGEAITMARNVISMGRVLSSIDPDVLHSLADELTQKKHKETTSPAPSLWRAAALFFSPDSRRALVGAAAFLRAFGVALAKGKTKR